MPHAGVLELDFVDIRKPEAQPAEVRRLHLLYTCFTPALHIIAVDFGGAAGGGVPFTPALHQMVLVLQQISEEQPGKAAMSSGQNLATSNDFCQRFDQYLTI